MRACVQGMNCSMNANSNKNGLFQAMCSVWKVVTDIATDGKAQTQCGYMPWDHNAHPNAHSPANPRPHSGIDRKRSGIVTEPDTSAREEDQVTSAQQPPTHCAVQDPRKCVGQSVALDGSDCFHWREFHSGFNGEKWFRCQNLWDDPCACASVTCSPDGTRLLALHLRGHNLEGRVDAGLLSGMTALTTLDLSYNRLYGSLGGLQLRNLTTLFLDNNLLSGKAPDLNYSAYTACSIANNSFDCPLPGNAAQCHRGWEKPPKCESMPVSSKCGEGLGRIYGNATIQSAARQLRQVGRSVERNS